MTAPQIIQMYKQIYNNWIKREEEIQKKAKDMIEADKIIKTKFFEIKTDEDFSQKAKKIHKYQRNKLKLRELREVI